MDQRTLGLPCPWSQTPQPLCRNGADLELGIRHAAKELRHQGGHLASERRARTDRLHSDRRLSRTEQSIEFEESARTMLRNEYKRGRSQ